MPPRWTQSRGGAAGEGRSEGLRPRFGRNQDRTVHRDALRPILVARSARRTRDEWFRDLTAAGVPCAPITTIDGGVGLA
ncbi:CoA transferase [Micromonospora sp. L31]|uniref:CoA transferase n=1 Tax=Micromonospora sp. L31 TaxID=3452213 RepID=UPI003F8B7EF8